MTIQEFIDCLCEGHWGLDAEGNLSDEDENCPLWHVYREQRGDDDDPEDYVQAGQKIGLTRQDAVAIAQAADGRGHPQLRKRLLAAVGLEEKPVTVEVSDD